MAATATARRATARSAPARKSRAARAPKARPTPAGRAPARARNASAARRPARRARRQASAAHARLVPAAVGRTAVALGGIADSRFVFRLTRGQLWIGALATMLVGIVAINVGALQLSATSSKAASQADALKRQNSTLSAQLAEAVSSSRMERTAAKLGLVVPEPGSIRYLSPSADDAAVAAKRLRDGELTGAVAAAAPPVPVPATEAPVAPVVAQEAVADPAAAEAAVVDPVATDPAAVAPASAPPPAPEAGGMTSP